MIEEQDPRLTSFVLGELEEHEAAEVAAEVAGSEELQRVVAEIQSATAQLDEMFRSESELKLLPAQRDELTRAASGEFPTLKKSELVGAGRHPLWGNEWSPSLMVAAALTMMMLGIGYLLSQPNATSNLALAPSERAGGMVSAEIASDEFSLDAVVERERSAGALPPMAKSGPEVQLAETRQANDLPELDSQSFDFAPGSDAPSESEAMAPPALAQSIAQAKGAGGGGFGGGGGGEVVEVPDGNATMLGGIRTRSRQSDAEAAPGELGDLAENSPAQMNQQAALGVGPEASLGEMKTQTAVPATPERAVLLGAAMSPNNMIVGKELAQSVADDVALVEQKTRQLLAEKGMEDLNLEVGFRRQSMVNNFEVPKNYYRHEKTTVLQDKGDGTQEQQFYSLNVLQQGNVQLSLVTDVVSPEVAFSNDQAAREFIDRLAATIDPEGKRELEIEDLIGVEGVVVNSPDTDPKELSEKLSRVDQTRGRRTLGRGAGQSGNMAVESKPAEPYGVATDNLIQYLHEQVTQPDQALADRQPSGAVQSGQVEFQPEADADQSNQAGDTAEGLAQAGQQDQGLNQPGQARARSQIPADSRLGMQLGGRGQQRAVQGNRAVLAVVPEKLEDVDVSRLMRQLEVGLQQRNRDVRQRNQSQLAEPGAADGDR